MKKIGITIRPVYGMGNVIFNPEIQQDPQSSDLPFICRSKRLLKVEDLTYVLASHYNETKYDPLGHGSQADKLKFRPISLNRTQNSHVLQIRNDVFTKNAALMWICFGVPTFTPYVPFYTNATDTDQVGVKRHWSMISPVLIGCIEHYRC